MDSVVNVDEITWMPVSELAFDTKNPRLAEFDISAKESELVKFLWEAMDVRELMLSVAASGYFAHEPMIVANERGKNIVIEGNRRLAAVKLLLDSALRKELKGSLPTATKEVCQSIKQIPCLMSSRQAAWRYLGFKHVNGPAKWGSYAKSQYIAKVHRDYGISIDEIACQIGDTHNTVRRLYQGLMVIEQAERVGAYDRADRWYSRLYFSHLYAGLQYPGISEFLSLRPVKDDESEPVPKEKQAQLRELLLWLYGSKSEQRPPVIQSQNPHLRQLDAVLANTEALAAMRNGAGLSVAFEASRPSSNIFEEALVAAKQNLEKARGVLSTGYDGSKALQGIAADVSVLAYDLHEEMLRNDRPRRGRRNSSD